jgi:hypothetical protein
MQLPSHVPEPERYFGFVVLAAGLAAYGLAKIESPKVRKIAAWVCWTAFTLVILGAVWSVFIHRVR